jgi:ubiquitin carboxyl-terminal hydrolase 44/49
MEDCVHVKQVKLAADRSFLNPRNWSCSECGTTESVWACLLCSHVACGRSCEEHALQHFHLSRHPLAIEVNLRYTYCYLCDDYILNDNVNGDIRLAQSLLSQVASQTYQESCTRSGRIIKPATQLLRAESR